MKSPKILFCWPVNLSEFVSLGWTGLVLQHQRAPAAKSHRYTTRATKFSPFGCFILVYSVTSRRDRRELVCDGMGGHMQMSWAECQGVALLRAVQRIQSAVAWSPAWVWGFLSIFSNNSINACGTMARLWWSFLFVYVAWESSPPISTHASSPPYSCLWLCGHL